MCQRTNWMWADDTPYRYPGWHKWRNRDPQSDEHCARLVPDHRAGWFGKPCDDPYAYICEKGERALPFWPTLFCHSSYVHY